MNTKQIESTKMSTGSNNLFGIHYAHRQKGRIWNIKYLHKYFP